MGEWPVVTGQLSISSQWSVASCQLQLVLRALIVGGAIAVLLAIGGAVLFRQQLEHRVAAIRRTVLALFH
jgi:hypothetical protein